MTSVPRSKERREKRTPAPLPGILSGDAAYKPKLTARQTFALEYVGAHQPVGSAELGAVLHAERVGRGGSGHPADESCEWCSDEGRSMGRTLRGKGLVRERRGEGWVLVSWRSEHCRTDGRERYDPATAPLPEGF